MSILLAVTLLSCAGSPVESASPAKDPVPPADAAPSVPLTVFDPASITPRSSGIPWRTSRSSSTRSTRSSARRIIRSGEGT
ncbi:MAG: hypothetical protein MZU95_08520 [Desulfomicrobium escambiense]|nr:hypothetical protein [Desulfomicrobium escambiense]